MNRRSILLGLGAALAAPAVIRTPGLLMPVRRLSAAEIDPTDINGIIAELPDGATWIADPNITYWADRAINIKGKVRVEMTGALVKIRNYQAGIIINDCRHVAFRDFTIFDQDQPAISPLPSPMLAAARIGAGEWDWYRFDAATYPAFPMRDLGDLLPRQPLALSPALVAHRPPVAASALSPRPVHVLGP